LLGRSAILAQDDLVVFVESFDEGVSNGEQQCWALGSGKLRQGMKGAGSVIGFGRQEVQPA
jgi:hypothetical protein